MHPYYLLYNIINWTKETVFGLDVDQVDYWSVWAERDPCVLELGK